MELGPVAVPGRASALAAGLYLRGIAPNRLLRDIGIHDDSGGRPVAQRTGQRFQW